MLLDKCRRIFQSPSVQDGDDFYSARQSIHWREKHFNILHSGVRVSFCVFILLTARFRGMFRGYSGVFQDAPLFPTMATPLEKALCSQGSRCRKVRLWYKPVFGSFFLFTNLSLFWPPPKQGVDPNHPNLRSDYGDASEKVDEKLTSHHFNSSSYLKEGKLGWSWR